MSTFAWATVAEVSPLRIRLDGDTAALPFIPDSLVDPSALGLGDRVRCELSSRRVVIVGRAQGVEPFPLVVPLGRGGTGVDAVDMAELKAALGIPFAQASGVAPVPASSSVIITGVYHSFLSVTFPVGRFTVPPNVTLGGSAGNGTVAAAGLASPDVTTSGFQARVIRFGGAVLSDAVLQWSAVQMTEDSASG